MYERVELETVKWYWRDVGRKRFAGQTKTGIVKAHCRVEIIAAFEQRRRHLESMLHCHTQSPPPLPYQ